MNSLPTSFARNAKIARLPHDLASNQPPPSRQSAGQHHPHPPVRCLLHQHAKPLPVANWLPRLARPPGNARKHLSVDRPVCPGLFRFVPVYFFKAYENLETKLEPHRFATNHTRHPTPIPIPLANKRARGSG